MSATAMPGDKAPEIPERVLEAINSAMSEGGVSGVVLITISNMNAVGQCGYNCYMAHATDQAEKVAREMIGAVKERHRVGGSGVVQA